MEITTTKCVEKEKHTWCAHTPATGESFYFPRIFFCLWKVLTGLVHDSLPLLHMTNAKEKYIIQRFPPNTPFRLSPHNHTSIRYINHVHLQSRMDQGCRWPWHLHKDLVPCRKPRCLHRLCPWFGRTLRSYVICLIFLLYCFIYTKRQLKLRQLSPHLNQIGYNHVFEEFNKAGFQVSAYDQRGFGETGTSTMAFLFFFFEGCPGPRFLRGRRSRTTHSLWQPLTKNNIQNAVNRKKVQDARFDWWLRQSYSWHHGGSGARQDRGRAFVLDGTQLRTSNKTYCYEKLWRPSTHISSAIAWKIGWKLGIELWLHWTIENTAFGIDRIGTFGARLGPYSP